MLNPEKSKLITSVIWTFNSFFLGDSRNNSSFEDQKHLALLVMETLTVLLQGSNTNAGNQKIFQQMLWEDITSGLSSVMILASEMLLSLRGKTTDSVMALSYLQKCNTFDFPKFMNGKIYNIIITSKYILMFYCMPCV